MKTEIEKFKQENGNDNFSNKEMLMYLITKGDKRDEEIKKINKQLGKGAGKIATNRANIKNIDKSNSRLWTWMYGLIFVIIGLAVKTIWF